MMEKPNEYDCEHIAFLADADGPMFMVKIKGHERHWYLRMTNHHARLVAADSSTYVFSQIGKPEAA